MINQDLITVKNAVTVELPAGASALYIHKLWRLLQINMDRNIISLGNNIIMVAVWKGLTLRK